jgi:hypothetical protein
MGVNRSGNDPVQITNERSRAQNANPDGIYTGTGVRNAAQGEGFIPQHDVNGQPLKAALKRSRRYPDID